MSTSRPQYTMPMRDRIAVVKNEVDVRDIVADELGAEMMPAGGDKMRTQCWLHQGDNTPSMFVYKDHYYCYACEAKGDAFDVVRHSRDMSFKEALDVLHPEGVTGAKPVSRQARKPREGLDRIKPVLAKSALSSAAQAEAVDQFIQVAQRVHPDALKEGAAWARSRGISNRTQEETGLKVVHIPDWRAAQEMGDTLKEEHESLAKRAGILRHNGKGILRLNWWDETNVMAMTDPEGRPSYLIGRRMDTSRDTVPTKYVNQSIAHGARHRMANVGSIREAADEGGELLMLEGAADAYAAHALGHHAAGVNHRLVMSDHLAEGRLPAVYERMLVEHRDELQAIERLVLVPDNDEDAGKRAEGMAFAKALQKGFCMQGIRAVVGTMQDYGATTEKDFSELSGTW